MRDGSERYSDESYTFNVAYNPTVRTIADVSEVLIQKAIEEGASPDVVEDFSGNALLYSAFLSSTERDIFIRSAARALGTSPDKDGGLAQRLLAEGFDQ